jgi:outer membrane protein assembly factor BamB
MKTTIGVLLLCAIARADDENWPHWRGPHHNGTSASKGLPVRWSATENVRWKAALPSWSGSSPVVWGDRVFVASGSEIAGGAQATVGRLMGKPPMSGPDVVLLCLSKKDGSVLWKHAIAGGNHLIGRQNMSSPSPVTDGSMVWWVTGQGKVTGLTVEGKVVWEADLQKSWGKFGLNWGYGASPLYWEGLLIVPVLHGMNTDDPSYLVAFDGKTGKVAWREERTPPEKTSKESPDSYTTPLPMKVGDRVEIVVVGGDMFSGHDPKTGKEIWRCAALNPTWDGFYRAVCSPAIVDDMIFGCIKKGPFVACKGGGKGDVTATNVAWTSTNTCDVPTPVSDGKYLYVLNDGGMLTCVDPKTGKVAYERQRLPGGTYDASPLYADGKIYCTNWKGRTTVVQAGPEFKVLSENAIDDVYTISSIAAAGKELFIRSSTHLYCIANK